MCRKSARDWRASVCAPDAGHGWRRSTPRIHMPGGVLNFRHHELPESGDCAQQASLAAARSALESARTLELPTRRLIVEREDEDGRSHRGGGSIEIESVDVGGVTFMDESMARVRFADGRELILLLIATGRTAMPDVPATSAILAVDLDGESFALDAPELATAKFELLVGTARWIRHWSDESIRTNASLEADRAVEAANVLARNQREARKEFTAPAPRPVSPLIVRKPAPAAPAPPPAAYKPIAWVWHWTHQMDRESAREALARYNFSWPEVSWKAVHRNR